YAPGDTARLQVRMPYRSATALLTLEREGVLWQRVVDLTGKAPVVEVPVPPEGAPNVFVSVLAVRGRDSRIQPTALVDLGRPAFKLGMTELRVGWDAHALKVNVTPERETWQPGERAAVAIAVSRADGKPLPPHAEVALAAVDEGLLELRPNTSWKVLEAMLKRRGIEVQTATAQMQVVGKRHYGRKAVTPGGGGGSGAGTRRVFDTLLLWAPKVALDAQGRARVEVPLNDSLTSFRIVAVASAGMAHFGTGSASIRSTQPLMLHAGLPAQVRSGDRYTASFTLRNAGDAPLDATLSATVSALDANGAASPGSPLPPRQLSLAPGESREVDWDYEAPAASGLRWQLTADAGAAARDALLVSQTVVPAVPLSTVQASTLQLRGESTLAVNAPAGALPGGGLRISLQPSLAGTPAGVASWFRQYPFRCLEQRASRAVALHDDAEWEAVLSELPGYLDEHGLARYFPGQGAGSEVLSAYLLSLAAAAGRELPLMQRMQLREGLVSVLEGRHQPRSPLPTADVTLRKLAIIAALARQPEGLNPGWLDSIDETPRLWPNSALVDWLDILLRAPDVPRHAERLQTAQAELRARLVPAGNQLMFASAPG
ncbi:MAG: alpha-2-macroglobulin, partial [Chloroflexi bacterium]|nr:alpha-2-macroglobulin [Chloroflexota bacterium]